MPRARANTLFAGHDVNEVALREVLASGGPTLTCEAFWGSLSAELDRVNAFVLASRDRIVGTLAGLDRAGDEAGHDAATPSMLAGGGAALAASTASLNAQREVVAAHAARADLIAFVESAVSSAHTLGTEFDQMTGQQFCLQVDARVAGLECVVWQRAQEVPLLSTPRVGDHEIVHFPLAADPASGASMSGRLSPPSTAPSIGSRRSTARDLEALSPTKPPMLEFGDEDVGAAAVLDSSDSDEDDSNDAPEAKPPSLEVAAAINLREALLQPLRRRSSASLLESFLPQEAATAAGAPPPLLVAVPSSPAAPTPLRSAAPTPLRSAAPTPLRGQQPQRLAVGGGTADFSAAAAAPPPLPALLPSLPRKNPPSNFEFIELGSPRRDAFSTLPSSPAGASTTASSSLPKERQRLLGEQLHATLREAFVHTEEAVLACDLASVGARADEKTSKIASSCGTFMLAVQDALIRVGFEAPQPKGSDGSLSPRSAAAAPAVFRSEDEFRSVARASKLAVFMCVLRTLKRQFSKKGEPHAAAAFEQLSNVFGALFVEDARPLPSTAQEMSTERRAYKYLRRLDMLVDPGWQQQGQQQEGQGAAALNDEGGRQLHPPSTTAVANQGAAASGGVSALPAAATTAPSTRGAIPREERGAIQRLAAHDVIEFDSLRRNASTWHPNHLRTHSSDANNSDPNDVPASLAALSPPNASSSSSCACGRWLLNEARRRWPTWRRSCVAAFVDDDSDGQLVTGRPPGTVYEKWSCMWTLGALWVKWRPELFDWLPTYSWRKNFLEDVKAGVAIGVLLIPQGLAYAGLAGIPPVYGVFTGLLPSLIYAVFGTSKHTAVGPMSLPALLIASSVSSLSPPPADADAFLGEVLALTFLCGVILLAMGWLRLGFVVRFISAPILTGFTIAAALMTQISVLKDVLGIAVPRSQVLQGYLHSIFATGAFLRTQWATALTGGLALAFLHFAPRLLARAPGPLKALPPSVLVVALSIAVYAAIMGATRDAGTLAADGSGWSTSFGVALTGAVPSAFPRVALPPLARVVELVPSAVGLVVIGYVESIAVAKIYAEKHGYRIDANSELKALGLANLLGSLSGAFLVMGALGRSSVNEAAGARSQLSGVVSAAVVLALLAFLMPLLFYLPKAVLAAMIIMSVLKLVKLNELPLLWRVYARDLTSLLVALLFTLFAGVLWGIGVSVFVSLALFVSLTTTPVIDELGLSTAWNAYVPISSSGDVLLVRPAKLLSFMGPLLYFNCEALKRRVVRELALRGSQPPERRWKFLVLSFVGITNIDSMGVYALEEILAELRKAGGCQNANPPPAAAHEEDRRKPRPTAPFLVIAQVPQNIVDVLDSSGFATKLGVYRGCFSHFCFLRTHIALSKTLESLEDEPLSMAADAAVDRAPIAAATDSTNDRRRLPGRAASSSSSSSSSWGQLALAAQNAKAKSEGGAPAPLPPPGPNGTLFRRSASSERVENRARTLLLSPSAVELPPEW